MLLLCKQICRFCWNHIRRNLNNKCPACRRDYSDDVGQFKPINKEECVVSFYSTKESKLSYYLHTCSQRRLTQQKKQRERERKDLDALGRRHLANVRVVQRNVVYVVGIGPRFAKEEVCLLCSILIMIVNLIHNLYSTVNFHPALKRLLWPIWPHFQDHIGKAHSARCTDASCRVIHHVPPPRGRRALYCCR
jgi:RING/Ubox like zinc-binding domain